MLTCLSSSTMRSFAPPCAADWLSNDSQSRWPCRRCAVSSTAAFLEPPSLTVVLLYRWSREALWSVLLTAGDDDVTGGNRRFGHQHGHGGRHRQRKQRHDRWVITAEEIVGQSKREGADGRTSHAY